MRDTTQRAKVNEDHLCMVIQLVKNGKTVKDAAREIGINYKTVISRIRRHKLIVPLKSRPIDASVRFWSKTKKVGDCIEWQAGFKNIEGYGAFKLNGKSINASRAAYILTHGKIPDGLIVCHKCDNPKCVNVDHLFLGTNYDNYWDAVNKGRRPRPTVMGFRG
jgi:hypothetical protein